MHNIQNYMNECGIPFSGVINPNGRMNRFYIKGDKPGSKNGWYVAFDIGGGNIICIFGSWKLGHKFTYISNGKKLSTAQKNFATQRLKAIIEENNRCRIVEQEKCAEQAQEKWDSLSRADHKHPYLVLKRIEPNCLRREGECLFVPLFDVHGKLWNLQRILPEGQKRFLKGRVKGLFSPIGDTKKPQKLIICEGWATGATLYLATITPVLCAMYAGNLLPVAEVARAYWPNAEIIIAADNDHKTIGNPGVTKATQAAQAVSGKLAVPEFPEGCNGTDFNDLANLGQFGGFND